MKFKDQIGHNQCPLAQGGMVLPPPSLASTVLVLALLALSLVALLAAACA